MKLVEIIVNPIEFNQFFQPKILRIAMRIAGLLSWQLVLTLAW